jgi:hypothetical protein
VTEEKNALTAKLIAALVAEAPELAAFVKENSELLESWVREGALEILTLFQSEGETSAWHALVAQAHEQQTLAALADKHAGAVDRKSVIDARWAFIKELAKRLGTLGLSLAATLLLAKGKTQDGTVSV